MNFMVSQKAMVSHAVWFCGRRHVQVTGLYIYWTSPGEARNSDRQGNDTDIKPRFSERISCLIDFKRVNTPVHVLFSYLMAGESRKKAFKDPSHIWRMHEFSRLRLQRRALRTLSSKGTVISSPWKTVALSDVYPPVVWDFVHQNCLKFAKKHGFIYLDLCSCGVYNMCHQQHLGVS